MSASVSGYEDDAVIIVLVDLNYLKISIMKRIFTLCAFLCAAITAGNAGEIVLCDFENYNVGDAFTMVNIYGPTTSTAEVVADPLNPDNKVLHVKVDNWNTFVQFALPEGITGKNLLDNYQKVSFDLYRSADQTNDHMQTAVLLGAVHRWVYDPLLGQ